MLASAPRAATKQCTDPFLELSSASTREKRTFRCPRPESLQSIIDVFGNILVANNATMMAKFTGCKIVHRLQTPSEVRVRVSEKVPAPVDLSDALGRLGEHHSDGRTLADALLRIASDLHWYQGASGPYASANFGHGHAHAILAGPGGLEERSDVRLGLSVLAPYTRFPDHDQTTSRVLLALSSGEFRSDGGEWFKEEVGALLFHPSGRQFAMRCTSTPLLVLWCQRLST